MALATNLFDAGSIYFGPCIYPADAVEAFTKNVVFLRYNVSVFPGAQQAFVLAKGAAPVAANDFDWGMPLAFRIWTDQLGILRGTRVSRGIKLCCRNTRSNIEIETFPDLIGNKLRDGSASSSNYPTRSHRNSPSAFRTSCFDAVKVGVGPPTPTCLLIRFAIFDCPLRNLAVHRVINIALSLLNFLSDLLAASDNVKRRPSKHRSHGIQITTVGLTTQTGSLKRNRTAAAKRVAY